MCIYIYIHIYIYTYIYKLISIIMISIIMSISSNPGLVQEVELLDVVDLGVANLGYY